MTTDHRFRSPLHGHDLSPEYFTNDDAYPAPRSNADLATVEISDKAAILALELELHNESQTHRRAAIIQTHLNRFQSARRPPVRIPVDTKRMRRRQR